MTGSSGLGETAFFPSPDNHRLPGHDLLVTLGGFLRGPDHPGGRGNVLDSRPGSRSMAHAGQLARAGADGVYARLDGGGRIVWEPST